MAVIFDILRIRTPKKIATPISAKHKIKYLPPANNSNNKTSLVDTV